MTAAPTPPRRTGSRVLPIVAALASSLLLLFLVAPIVGLVGSGGAAGLRGLAHDADLRKALALTALCATIATSLAAVGGTPLAWVLARRSFPGRAVVSALLDLPLLIPHPVAGIALLLVLGRASPAGAALLAAGVRLVGTPVGIVAAMLFVAAPIFVAGAREAFARVDERYERAARTLGDSSWNAVRRVTLPLAGRGLASSAIVTWARAVSEFGAVVVLTYNPKTVSVLAWDRFTTDGLPGALPVAGALVLLALVPLALFRALRYDGGRP